MTLFLNEMKIHSIAKHKWYIIHNSIHYLSKADYLLLFSHSSLFKPILFAMPFESLVLLDSWLDFVRFVSKNGNNWNSVYYENNKTFQNEYLSHK